MVYFQHWDMYINFLVTYYVIANKSLYGKPNKEEKKSPQLNPTAKIPLQSSSFVRKTELLPF